MSRHRCRTELGHPARWLESHPDRALGRQPADRTLAMSSIAPPQRVRSVPPDSVPAGPELACPAPRARRARRPGPRLSAAGQWLASSPFGGGLTAACDRSAARRPMTCRGARPSQPMSGDSSSSMSTRSGRSISCSCCAADSRSGGPSRTSRASCAARLAGPPSTSSRCDTPACSRAGTTGDTHSGRATLGSRGRRRSGGGLHDPQAGRPPPDSLRAGDDAKAAVGIPAAAARTGRMSDVSAKPATSPASGGSMPPRFGARAIRFPACP